MKDNLKALAKLLALVAALVAVGVYADDGHYAKHRCVHNGHVAMCEYNDGGAK